MLAATAKIGSKYLVHIEILKAFGAEVEKLPDKEKVMLDFKSAVVFLRPFLELAVKKNYTKDEIFQIMVKVGWRITQNTFKYFWSLYLLEEENFGQKRSNHKSARKTKTETSRTNVGQNEIKSLEVLSSDFSPDKRKINEHSSEEENSHVDVQKFTPETNELQTSVNENLEAGKSGENSTQQNSAHFDLPPDTEDL